MTLLPRSPRSIDWTQVRERLDRARADGASVERSAARGKAIMEERAALLARARDQMPAGPSIEVLTFVLASLRYAIETTCVREIVRLSDLTPIPGAPAFVAGITNHRGQILCVMDLRSLFPASARGVTDLSHLLVLGVDQIEFGILADQVDDIIGLPLADILTPPESIGGAGREYLRGVTPQDTRILDGATLLRDARLFVDVRKAGTP